MSSNKFKNDNQVSQSWKKLPHTYQKSRSIFSHNKESSCYKNKIIIIIIILIVAILIHFNILVDMDIKKFGYFPMINLNKSNRERNWERYRIYQSRKQESVNSQSAPQKRTVSELGDGNLVIVDF